MQPAKSELPARPGRGGSGVNVSPPPTTLPGRGFAVGAGLDPALAARLAHRCEELGYESVWSNDHAAVGPPSGSGMATLAALAAGSDRLALGIGTLALDRHSPASIEAEVERLGVDPQRLILAVGAGNSHRPLELATGALEELRARLGRVRILLAALGPRMCELGGRSFDGVLVAWMTPAAIERARERLEAGAAAAARPAPPLAGYVRASVGADAETRLAREEGFYRALPAWRRNFAALDSDPGRTGVFGDYPDDLVPELDRYARCLDLLVIRGLAAPRMPMLERIAAAAAPAQPSPAADGATSSSVSRATTTPKAK